MKLEDALLMLYLALMAFYLLPIWFLIRFAKREKKDWRIALVTGLLFTWLFAFLILLIVPKLSDEDAERINGKPKEHKSFSMTGMKIPSIPTPDLSGASADDFKPVLWVLGVCAVVALGLMGWVATL